MNTPSQTSRRQYESVGDAAARVGVSTKTVRRWIASGQLAGYRIGPAASWQRARRRGVPALADQSRTIAGIEPVTSSVSGINTVRHQHWQWHPSSARWVIAA
jgi:excisionase family DNA binding protein